MGLFDKLRGLDPQSFAKAVVCALTARGESRRMRFYEPSTLEIARRAHLELGEVYEEHRAASGRERTRILDAFADAVRAEAVPDTWEKAAPHVLPVLRETRAYEVMTLEMRAGHDARDDEEPFVTEPLTEHLSVGLVHARPHLSEELGPAHVAAWRVDLDAVKARAVANLGALGASFVPAGAGAFRVKARDAHAAARLLLADEIRALDVKGDPIALTPNRETLIVTGAEDGGALKAVGKELCGPIALGLSGTPSRLTDEGWKTWLPSTKQLRFAAIANRWMLYQRQTAALEHLYARKGETVFVSDPFDLGEPWDQLAKKDESTDACAWVESEEGVPQLLPEATWVTFMAADGTGLGVARWSRVREKLAHRMKPMGWSLERWRVERFPGRREIAAVVEATSRRTPACS